MKECKKESTQATLLAVTLFLFAYIFLDRNPFHASVFASVPFAGFAMPMFIFGPGKWLVRACAFAAAGCGVVVLGLSLNGLFLPATALAIMTLVAIRVSVREMRRKGYIQEDQTWIAVGVLCPFIGPLLGRLPAFR